MSSRSQPWLRLLGHALLLVLWLGTCVFAIALVPHRAGLLFATALEVVGGPSDARRAPWKAGALAFGFATVLTGSLGIARAAVSALPVDAEVAEWIAGAVALLVPSAIGAVCAPFLLAPHALLDGEDTVLAALVRSFELAARRGARATIRDGARLGVMVGIVALLIGRVLQARHGDLALLTPALAAGVLIAIAAALGALLLARAYVDACGRAAFDAPAGTPVASSLRVIAIFVVPAAAVLAAAIAAAVITPTPLREGPRGVEAGGAARVEVPGEHGLVVRATARGLAVETADGGGAGAIALPRDAELESPALVRVSALGGALRVLRGRYYADVDARGVRLDDGLGARVAARLEGQVALALCAALVLAALWVRALRARAQQASVLDAPDEGDAAAQGAGVVRISGKLHLEPGATVLAHGDEARVHDRARFVSRDGTIVVALPETVPLVVAHELGAIPDGSEIAIVAPREALARVGPREGATPWPEGARLLLRDRDDAAEALLGSAARGSALLALGVAGALASAAWMIVARL